jgi:hypothetical protein
MVIRVTCVEWTYLGLEWHHNSLDIIDVAPPTIKLNDSKGHASLLSSFLLNNSFVILVLIK